MVMKMRLIDADALKQMVWEDDRINDLEYATVTMLIEKQPTIGGWISVKDRLPDKTPCEYLVVNNGVVGTAIYHDGMWIAPTWRVNVTHWQAMPELPKENEDD